MFIIELAKIKIKVHNRFDFVYRQCLDYIIQTNDFDLELKVDEEDLIEESKKSKNEYSCGYLESICIYRKICLLLPSFDCFLLHAAVVMVDGYAYAFCAKSGTGKTTHTRLWKELLGDKMKYINGDKPIIRLIDGIPYAFGTPWNGKERYGDNISSQLISLCFIERGETNKITPLDKKQILGRILHQILIPKDEINTTLTFSLLDKALKSIDTYVLQCNMELEAAKVSYNEMKR